MSYSVDLAYLDYFKNASAGMHDSSCMNERLNVAGIAGATTLIAAVETVARIVKVVVEVTKIIFYALATLFTLGNYGNLERLRDHCKLFALNTAGLLAQPLQMAIHSLAIFIGVASPKAAYHMMQYATTPIAWVSSNENKVWQEYNAPEFYTKSVEWLQSKTASLFDNCSHFIKIAAKTVIHELSCAYDIGLIAPLGYMEEFHAFGANPTELTQEQKQLTPILLLNGNYSHQGLFLPLLHKLKSVNNKRPVYTINLPPNTTNPLYIKEKVDAIKAQYGKSDDKNFKIDVLGHSMGSNLMQNALKEWQCQEQVIRIRRAIASGTPFFRKDTARCADEAFDLMGSKDFFDTRKSLLAADCQFTINTGHAGLLFDENSLNKMAELLMKA